MYFEQYPQLGGDLGKLKLKKLTKPFRKVLKPVNKIVKTVSKPVRRVIPKPIRKIAKFATAPLLALHLLHKNNQQSTQTAINESIPAAAPEMAPSSYTPEPAPEATTFQAQDPYPQSGYGYNGSYDSMPPTPSSTPVALPSTQASYVDQSSTYQYPQTQPAPRYYRQAAPEPPQDFDYQADQNDDFGYSSSYLDQPSTEIPSDEEIPFREPDIMTEQEANDQFDPADTVLDGLGYYSDVSNVRNQYVSKQYADASYNYAVHPELRFDNPSTSQYIREVQDTNTKKLLTLGLIIGVGYFFLKKRR
jgi:hypothetical protein